MGQMYTFDVADTKQLAKTACAKLKGVAPVMMGCSGIWDRNYDKRPDPKVFREQALELSKFAEGEGADAVVHTMPEALVPEDGQSIEDLVYDFFEMICGAVSVPVFIYQPPGTPEEYQATEASMRRLADIDNLVGMKASTNDAYYQFKLLRALRDKDFGFIAGAETAYYSALLAGGRACIGQGCTLNPKVVRAVRDFYDAGDFDGVRRAQESTNLLVEECPNAVDFMKRYATEHGYAVGPHSRSMTSNPYMQDRNALGEEAYQAYKHLFEEETAKFE
jgi:4-hydroxy-tetrahydrodipicolinate synthase